MPLLEAAAPLEAVALRAPLALNLNRPLGTKLDAAGARWEGFDRLHQAPQARNIPLIGTHEDLVRIYQELDGMYDIFIEILLRIIRGNLERNPGTGNRALHVLEARKHTTD